MKKLTRLLLALATLCSLRACAGTDLLSGKELTLAMGEDGKPQIGIKIGGVAVK